jgi:hypothetical protein
MREGARQRVLERLGDDDLLLDVGGWAVPFPRADWMLDLAPYETRGEWGYEGDPAEERFTAETWVQRDICDREPWPFADKQFDFVVCSHTLEDVRDPVWVCSELIRVAKAGYIEVPSRLEEQTYSVHGPWTGWSHHHWLIDIDQDAASIDFVFKHHIVHAPGPNRFKAEFRSTLSDDERVQSLWWEGSFDYRERIFLTAVDLESYLQDFVAAHGPPDEAPSEPAGRRRPWRRG